MARITIKKVYLYGDVTPSQKRYRVSINGTQKGSFKTKESAVRFQSRLNRGVI
jgi:hypothetical protein